jgi:hypothetical protein
MRAWLHVKLVDAQARVSAFADTSALTGPKVAPSVPRNVRLEPSGQNVFVQWDAVASYGSSYVKHYVVQRSTSATGPWTTIATLYPYDFVAFQFGDGPLADVHRYYYRVAAVNNAG